MLVVCVRDKRHALIQYWLHPGDYNNNEAERRTRTCGQQLKITEVLSLTMLYIAVIVLIHQ